MLMQNYLQLFFVSLNPTTDKFEYVSNEFLMPPQNPDLLAQRMMKTNYPDIENKYLVQTTGWHFEEPSKVLLTYIVYSDYYDFADAEVLEKVEATESSWLQSKPENSDRDFVLSHGIRTLSYLIIRDKPPKWMLTSSIEKFVKLEKELAQTFKLVGDKSK
ncbi:MAG: hypothetical protein NVSMB46_04190 [Candidatus Saccharimonadales bacterium]